MGSILIFVDITIPLIKQNIILKSILYFNSVDTSRIESSHKIFYFVDFPTITLLVIT